MNTGNRVGIFTHNVDRGGVQRVSIVETKELEKRGYEPRLHSVVAPTDPWRELLDGVEYDYSLPYESTLSEAVSRVAGTLVRPRFDADINVCHNLPGAQLGYREHSRNGTPYVVYMHDSGIYPIAGNPYGLLFADVEADSRIGRYLSHIADECERNWLSNAEHIFVNSNYTKNEIESKFGFETEYLYPTTIPDMNLPDIEREDFFLVVQRMESHPTYELVRTLLDRIDEMKVVFTGKKKSDILYQRVKKRFEPYRGRVAFEPNPTDSELQCLYNRALAYLQPGHENFNMSAMEAASTGSPIVVSRESGIAELFPEYPLFCPGSELDRFEGAIKALLSSPEFRREMGTRARTTAEKWDKEYHMETLLSVIE